MSSLFAQTVVQAISDYRRFLRKSYKQSERVQKLEELNLNDPELLENDLRLYNVAWGIVTDIKNNVEIPEQNYYSYSGIAKFCDYLREYLLNYEVEGNSVIHKGQKASRAMIQAIQLLCMAGGNFTEALAKKMEHCNEIIVTYGSKEQYDLHISALERQRESNPQFFERILENFQGLIAEPNKATA